MTHSETSSMWLPTYFIGRRDFHEPSVPDLFGGEKVVSLQCSLLNVSGDRDLFEALSHALRFPDYFGRNWDALDECLSDMEWMPGVAYRLVLTNSDDLWAEIPETMGRFISCWLTAAEHWKSEGVPFQLVVLLEG